MLLLILSKKTNSFHAIFLILLILILMLFILEIFVQLIEMKSHLLLHVFILAAVFFTSSCLLATFLDFQRLHRCCCLCYLLQQIDIFVYK